MRPAALLLLAGCPGKPDDSGEPAPTCTWTAVWTGEDPVYGIGLDGDDVVAVGKSADDLSALVLRGGAEGFAPETPATTLRAELQAVDGNHAVGSVTEGFDVPQVMAWTHDAAWTDAGLAGDGQLRDVSGGVAVGVRDDRGIVWRHDGTSWAELPFDTLTTPYVTHAVWATGPDDAVIAGETFSEEAALWTWDGSAFDASFPDGGALYDVWGSYAVGADGTVLRDGAPVDIGTSDALYGVSGAGGSAYVVGGSAHLYRDGSWFRIDEEVGGYMDVVATSADRAFVVAPDPLESTIWMVECR